MEDYREILEEEFVQRKERNSAYSLRSFSRDLGFNQTRLSDVLKGRIGLSESSANQISDKLAFDEEKANYFRDLVLSKHARSPKIKEDARERLVERKSQISNDRFEYVSKWYCFAILEFVHKGILKSKTDLSVAKRLGVSEIEFNSALKSLEKAELIKIQRNQISTNTPETKVVGGIPSDAIKKYHSQKLDKAKDALYLQSIDQREFLSVNMMISKDQVNDAREMIHEFKNKFKTKIKESSKNEELYAFNIQFFSLENKK